VTDRDDLAEKVILLCSHGMTSLSYDRHPGHAYSNDVIDLGFNYRNDEIRAALGSEQLKKLTANNHRRKVCSEGYWHKFASRSVGLPFKNVAGFPSHHILPILLPDGVNREAFINALRSKGIQTSIPYPAIHRSTYYRSRYGDLSLP
jgi:dTDP-4-amino-4,6-dideoxygalactose transaminase